MLYAEIPLSPRGDSDDSDYRADAIREACSQPTTDEELLLDEELQALSFGDE